MVTPARRSTYFPSLFHGDWSDLLEAFGTPTSPPEGLRLEEYVDDGHLVIRAEMPGIDPERDVDITVQHGSLRIRATRRAEHHTEEKDYFRTEFHYGSFTRVVPLPAGASEDDVVADYQDGILKIRVPLRSEREAARRIQVQRPGDAADSAPE